MFLAIALWIFRSVRARKLWPSAPGMVTGGAIRQRTSGVGEEESVSFIPVVEYRFEIGAAAYTAAGIGFGETGYGSRAMAEKVLARYPAGSVVNVYYNPANPNQTFLEAGGGVIGWIMLAVGAALLAVSVVLGIYRV